MFLVKKLISALLLPLSGGLALIGLGLLLLWRKRRPRLARASVVVGATAILLSSCGLFSDALLAPLENAYPAQPTVLTATHAVPASEWIVILGGGSLFRVNTGPNVQLSTASQVRITEGLRIWRSLPQARLLFTGAGTPPAAQLAAETAIALGVPATSITTEVRARDTADEAHMARDHIAAGATITLVTSASHMPRAAALFRKQGFTVRAAPTDFQSAPGFMLGDLVPSGQSMRNTEIAVHEYIGYISSLVRGQL